MQLNVMEYGPRKRIWKEDTLKRRKQNLNKYIRMNEVTKNSIHSNEETHINQIIVEPEKKDTRIVIEESRMGEAIKELKNRIVFGKSRNTTNRIV